MIYTGEIYEALFVCPYDIIHSIALHFFFDYLITTTKFWHPLWTPLLAAIPMCFIISVKRLSLFIHLFSASLATLRHPKFHRPYFLACIIPEVPGTIMA